MMGNNGGKKRGGLRGLAITQGGKEEDWVATSLPFMEKLVGEVPVKRGKRRFGCVQVLTIPV